MVEVCQTSSILKIVIFDDDDNTVTTTASRRVTRNNNVNNNGKVVNENINEADLQPLVSIIIRNTVRKIGTLRCYHMHILTL